MPIKDLSRSQAFSELPHDTMLLQADSRAGALSRRSPTVIAIRIFFQPGTA